MEIKQEKLNEFTMKINILAIEKYLPGNRISSETLDTIVNGVKGRIEKNTGVKYRHHVANNESVADMGTHALKKALEQCSLTTSDIDLLLFCGASFDYPVPHTSVLIKKQLTKKDDFPCFDINSTCLSFLNAIDVAHLYLQSKKYKRIAIVCSEIASKALTPTDEKVFGLFGDAAVALIIEANDQKGYNPIFSHFKNDPTGALYAYVPIGGAINRGQNSSPNDPGYYFKMNGKSMIKLVETHIDGFVKSIEEETNYSIKDFDHIITHQASKYGGAMFKKRFSPKEDSMIETLYEYGNCISASIPLGLEKLINEKNVKSPQKVLLIGTGAGLSFGAIVLNF